MLTKNKKTGQEGLVQRISQPSPDRLAAILPALRHLRRMQMADASIPPTTRYKQQEAETKPGASEKWIFPEILPIIGADTDNPLPQQTGIHVQQQALPEPRRDRHNWGHYPGKCVGLSCPRIFDKVIDISECYLMDDVNNRIRNTIRDFANDRGYPFMTSANTAAGSAISSCVTVQPEN